MDEIYTLIDNSIEAAFYQKKKKNRIKEDYNRRVRIIKANIELSYNFF